MECSAPGSVLLLGEYAVLSTGGLGVAAAVELCVQVRMQRGGTALLVDSTDGIDHFSWPGLSSGLLGSVVKSCAETLGRVPGPARVTVDSGELTDGSRKLGLGSSAAVAVAVTAVLLAVDGAVPPLDEVFRTALRAHRGTQGGRGSGYDVAVSTYGGLGLFRGGDKPCYEPLPAGPTELLLVLGDRPLATPLAIGRYIAWAERRPNEARHYRTRSDEIVRRALETGQWGKALRAGRNLTRQLGKAIGVEVEPSALGARLDEVAAAGHDGKPAGAGGELGVCAPAPGAAVPQKEWVRSLTVSRSGVCAP